MPSAGDAYGLLIGEQLTEEWARKTSLEQRGLSVITTSGALVTLLFGLAALTTKPQGYSVPDGATFCFVMALIAFVVAAGLGIAINAPRLYREVDVAELRRSLEDKYWKANKSIGTMRSAELRLDILEVAQQQNGNKAELLTTATIAQVIAVSFVALGIAVVLFAG